MAATNGYKPLHLKLSVTQENVIDRLVAGDSDQQAADAVGVHRTSVTRWRLHHPGFQASLNERRQQVFGSAVDKLRSLTHRALDTLAAKMDEGNVVAAIAVLKAASLDKTAAPPAGPTDADKIIGALVEQRIATKRDRRRSRQTTSEMLEEEINPKLRERHNAEDADAAIREVADEINARLRDDPLEPASVTDTEPSSGCCAAEPEAL